MVKPKLVDLPNYKTLVFANKIKPLPLAKSFASGSSIAVLSSFQALNSMKSALEFETEGSDVGRWKQKMQRCSGSSSVFPPEIIENILCRLPVKDLLRFRVVCKQWEATISDPVFTDIHLQHHKNSNSSSRNHLLAFPQPRRDCKELHIVELRNNCIEFVSACEPARDDFTRMLIFCSCDGLYLKCCPCEDGVPSYYVLWNPSRRAYRKLYSPLAESEIHAMYYDPLMKDYKIVIADMECYAVYSCRGNKWGEVKEMKGVWGNYFPGDAVYVDGSIYWLAMDATVDVEEEVVHEKPRGVICFDCKNENFKTLPSPTNCTTSMLSLTSLGGHLCLFISSNWLQRYSGIKIMKKVTGNDGKDGWMESKEEFLSSYKPENRPHLACVLSENELLFDEAVSVGKIAYLLYDKSKNTIEKILNNYDPECLRNPLPYLENLLLL